MPDRDFFAFCTSLTRPELRMVGELSWVRHLGEGEVLYRPGEPGNALFIINRGEVEVLTGTDDLEPIRLARGQVIGDVKLFLNPLEPTLSGLRRAQACSASRARTFSR